MTRSASGTCVQLVVTRPDAGEQGDGGVDPDAGTGGEACTAVPGWTTRVLDEGIDNITTAFVFDAQGVGHYAYSKDERLHVGTTRPGDVPVRVEGVTLPFDMTLALGPGGTRHLLFQQGTQVGYAHDTGGVWQPQLLATGWSAALALDAQGAPYLLIGQPSPQMGYVLGTRSPTGGWDLTPLEALGIKGDRERMVVDAAGHLHVAFVRPQGTNNQVVYASNASGTWSAEPLDWWLPLSSPRYRIALEVDALGQPSVVGSNSQGAWLWTKEASGWKSYGLGAYLSRGPAVVRSARYPNIRHVLLDDADPNADVHGSNSQMVLRSLYDTTVYGATPPLVLETRDGGNAFPGASALHVADQDQAQAGFSYVHYNHLPDGGLETTRGLRYARYCR
ncbi:hypothetical protein [Corallococcus aberystwythensis]|uniref:Exo-alpha-sialidase n=1 Tax=Corallococcus aberystwythensis TaxID=2316722 RepID=A0A3A8PGK9_9BACT|nr:hypothetical protein [Corallococcus aberystwythensis]RKH50884.1 hypothetical protein D7W81_40890 [Corallococcus aberystwythensis]